MISPSQICGPRQLLCLRGLLCLFLALTFLYNPFLGATSPVQYPSVSHPPSFRATVASSELLKFKPKEQGEIHVVQNDLAFLVVAVAPDSSNPVPLAFADAPG